MTVSSRRKALYLLACLAVVFIWSGSFIFIRIGLRDFPPATLALFRFAFAFPCLLLAHLLTKNKARAQLTLKKNFVEFTVLALTGVTLLYILQFYSLRLISASVGATVINTTVIFMALLSAAFLNERLTLKRILGILIAFIGVSMLLLEGEGGVNALSSQLLGGSLMIGAAVCWAVYSVLTKKILSSYSNVTTMAVTFGLGTLYLIPFVLIEDPFKVAARASAMGWLSVLYLATLSSALAYFLWNEAIAKLEVTKVGAFLYAIPIPTMILGYFFLSEEITLALVAGVLLVIFGIYLTEAS